MLLGQEEAQGRAATVSTAAPLLQSSGCCSGPVVMWDPGPISDSGRFQNDPKSETKTQTSSDATKQSILFLLLKLEQQSKRRREMRRKVK